MASAIDSARRQAIAHCLNQAQMAYAMDQATLAIYAGEADPAAVSEVVKAFFQSVHAASRDLVSGLVAICPKSDEFEIGSTSEGKSDG